jgi:hypothetical protein
MKNAHLGKHAPFQNLFYRKKSIRFNFQKKQLRLNREKASISELNKQIWKMVKGPLLLCRCLGIVCTIIDTFIKSCSHSTQKLFRNFGIYYQI